MKELRIAYSDLTGVTDKASWDFVVKPFLIKKGFDLSRPITIHRDFEHFELVYLQETR